MDLIISTINNYFLFSNQLRQMQKTSEVDLALFNALNFIPNINIKTIFEQELYLFQGAVEYSYKAAMLVMEETPAMKKTLDLIQGHTNKEAWQAFQTMRLEVAQKYDELPAEIPENEREKFRHISQYEYHCAALFLGATEKMLDHDTQVATAYRIHRLISNRCTIFDTAKGRADLKLMMERTAVVVDFLIKNLDMDNILST